MNRRLWILVGAAALLGGFAFASAAKADEVVIADITENVSITYASVSWTTDVLATGKLEYGTVSGTYTTSLTTVSDTFHEVSLSDLTPSTTYYYKITATTPDGVTAMTAERSFTTESDDLSILSREIVARGPDKIVLKVTTNKDVDVTVKYGTSSDDLDKTSSSVGGAFEYGGMCGNTQTWILLKDLKPKTRYYYQIKISQTQFCTGTDKSTTDSIRSVRTTGQPTITKITPTSGKKGTRVTITGLNFGTGLSKGHKPIDAVVSFGCPLSTWLKPGANIKCFGYIESWTDKKIVVKTLSGAKTGRIYIGKAFTGRGMGISGSEYLKLFVVKGPKFTVK